MELPAFEGLSREDRQAYLTEDLLSLMSTEFAGEYWRTEPDPLILDLGWYTPLEGPGFYRLNVIHASREEPVISMESGDQYIIRDAIDNILERLSEGTPIEEISLSDFDG
ncbi:hypothetical protein [Streptomyces sp. NPDC017993]|uniref:hypothetical protein n=1 Tax=Streptomyces sp. NPDC017993 TaxID=3365027 RepID=UPI0037A29D6D